MKVRSKLFYERALKSIPGGVNSPVRACKAVKGDPIFFEKGEGAYLIDVDGNRYIDYVCSWGPLILGHSHPEVIASVYFASKRGTSFGAPTWQEVELAELIKNCFPSIDKIRLVNSGTEATMSAIRLARAYTKRNKIIKFEGCYHGHVDSLLVKAGSGLATFGIPASPGIPEELTAHTLNLPFNDFEAVEKAFKEYGKEIAGVIVEPIVGNMGVVLPKEGFLEFLRDITTRYEALLIFDEVITGFRIGLSGAQGKFGVTPDLTCLGKIIGGGLPVGAYGGKSEIMSLVAPEGPVYQAGTLSGNPIAISAGLATLRELMKPGTYEKLEAMSQKLEEGIKEVLKKLRLFYTINRAGSMLTLFFTEKEVIDFQTALSSDTQKFAIFWQKMLDKGIYLPPSQFEAWFVSLAHGEKEIEETVEKVYESLKEMS
ncbi:MAG: Glutamate-1-semialdehyde aminotransferase [Thermodesulfobacterium sp.]|uniref:Glutamate-1-semialdehyde 2,1-aminomutase n=1 Tax=Candidatus Thermodesulfobacterium syntrophicum TaxID=3060442 RepID=A0AAE3P5D6_9BACT|nr:Glutamate-1-semialdehyde aminotransferase [Candidatus Thermodesulfobacterium syntrophicum]